MSTPLTSVSRIPVLIRFWTYVNRRDPNDCWLWNGPIAADGYGLIMIMSKTVRAHRLSWTIHHPNEVCEGWVICHTCDNPRCVNPNHLFRGTYTDNNRDTVKKGRHFSNRKLTEDNVKIIRYRYAHEQITMTSLAKEYGICRTWIGRIINRRFWKRLDDELNNPLVTNGGN